MNKLSNPNGEKGTIPGAEELDWALTRAPSLYGFSSAPIVNKHQVSDL